MLPSLSRIHNFFFIGHLKARRRKYCIFRLFSLSKCAQNSHLSKKMGNTFKSQTVNIEWLSSMSSYMSLSLEGFDVKKIGFDLTWPSNSHYTMSHVSPNFEPWKVTPIHTSFLIFPSYTLKHKINHYYQVNRCKCFKSKINWIHSTNNI